METKLAPVVLLIPAIMLVTGLIFSFWTPKSINYLMGYRTRRSMQNEKTWFFANRTMGKIWVRWGLYLLAPSFLFLFWSKGKSVNAQTAFSLVLTLVQLLTMTLSIIPVERALKAHFDEEGRPRERGIS